MLTFLQSRVIHGISRVECVIEQYIYVNLKASVLPVLAEANNALTKTSTCHDIILKSFNIAKNCKI